MPKETKTIQCYPNDYIINERIKRYEAFGWELINNQRCQESGGSIGGYQQVSTFNKLTFTREKSAPWYNEVAELENRYDSLMNSEPYQKKPSKVLLLASILALIFAVGMLIPTLAMLSAGFMIIPGVPGIVFLLLDVVLFVLYGVKKSRYKKEYKERMREWEQTSKPQALALRKQAEALVNG